MEELLEVVKFHLPRYVKIKSSPAQVNPSDMTFATKFVAMYLFIKLQGSRPRTVDMIATAKEKSAFIDQKAFKTAGFFDYDRCKNTSAQ